MCLSSQHIKPDYDHTRAENHVLLCFILQIHNTTYSRSSVYVVELWLAPVVLSKENQHHLRLIFGI